MSVINAAKILISRFGIVWGIMLFILIYALILLSLSMMFLIPVINALQGAGLFIKINELYDLLLNSSFSIAELSAKLSEIKETFSVAYSTGVGVKVSIFLLLTVVLTIANKFLLGYYELPVMEILHDKMSYNAKTGFFGRFVSNIKRSTLFVLVKMIYTILADLFIAGVVLGIFGLWGLHPLLTPFLPFIAVLVFIPLISLRYSVITCWAPAVVIDGRKTFEAFKFSTKAFRVNFGRTFGGFVIAWTFLIVFNALFAILTFGAALVLTIPVSMAFICALNMTIYYANTGRRYYLTDEHIQKADTQEADIQKDNTQKEE